MMDTELTIDEWEDIFQPIMNKSNDDIEHFYKLPYNELNSISSELGTKEYQHVWTAVETENDIVFVNGTRVVNSLYFIICKNPWGDGNTADSKIYTTVS